MVTYIMIALSGPRVSEQVADCAQSINDYRIHCWDDVEHGAGITDDQIFQNELTCEDVVLSWWER
jgi:hypothetical protein